MNEEFITSFTEEVNDLLVQLENDLMSLEKNPENAEIINGVFRVMHTLKGSAGMVGFKSIQDLTHEFEGVYDQIRSGVLTVSPEIITLTLQGKDLILAILKNGDDDVVVSDLIRLLRERYMPVKTQDLEGQPELLSGLPLNQRVYAIIFSPDIDIFERGLDPDKALNEIRTTGTFYLVNHEKKKPWPDQKLEKKCRTIWEIYLSSSFIVSEIQDVFLFYDTEEVEISEIKPKQICPDTKYTDKINSLYKKKKDPALHLRECLKLIPETIKETVAAPVEYEDKGSAKSASDLTSKIETDSTVNVSSHKLDELMNLVSELVTITASMQATAAAYKDPKLNNCLEYVEKLTKKFRNNALDLRLVPVATLFRKFSRLVRDLSRELDKSVDLIIEGHEIEIDKTILRSIESPLQHIIRNSIDHGLERREERTLKGKPPEGLIKIAALYSGASVIIQVQDDGNGINLDRVRECAVKKGFIQQDQAVTKQELINLIIEPGFSTAENVSMVSGRGVGMDVVKKELNKVGGSIDVFTEKDLGTTITLKLPTTLSIIDTLMVDVGNTQILIPVMDIEYCFTERRERLQARDNDYIQYKNNPIPLISLREKFNYPDCEQEEQMVVVIDKQEKKYALIADQIIGEYQAVIKPLGDLFSTQPLFTGGSILVDGKLAFILDTNFIFNHVIKN